LVNRTKVEMEEAEQEAPEKYDQYGNAEIDVDGLEF